MRINPRRMTQKDSDSQVILIRRLKDLGYPKDTVLEVCELMRFQDRNQEMMKFLDQNQKVSERELMLEAVNIVQRMNQQELDKIYLMKNIEH